MRFIYIFSIGIAAAAVQACSAAGVQPPVAPAQRAVRQAAQTTRALPGLPQSVYVADALKNTVDVFKADGTLDFTIADGLNSPAGLFLDGNQNLWVANQSNVLMFPPGQTTATRTLQDPGGSPDDISVAKNGTVYVSNFYNDSVSIYAPGSDVPTTTLGIPGAQYVVGVANDRAGDLFVTYNDSTGVGRLVEFAGGKQTGYRRLAPRFSWASDIKVDNDGNLLVLDGSQFSITEYTKNGRATGVSFNTFYQWNAFDVSAGDRYVAGTDSLADHDLGVLETFPQGQHVARFFNKYNGGISGVAIAPGHFQ